MLGYGGDVESIDGGAGFLRLLAPVLRDTSRDTSRDTGEFAFLGRSIEEEIFS